MTTIDTNDILFVLTTEDIEFFYDERLKFRGKEGSFRALSSSDRKTRKEYVKRNLEHGLGTAMGRLHGHISRFGYYGYGRPKQRRLDSKGE